MVKGISKQVIVVNSADKALFEQAIFILRADAQEVSDELLLKAARQAAAPTVRRSIGPLWAAGGAICTAALWLLTAIL